MKKLNFSLNFFFVVAFAVFLIFLSGCAKKECKANTDCTSPPGAADAFTASCEKSKCYYKEIANKCGNNKCDANENKCTCEKDCGACSGTNGSLNYVCYEKQCYLNLTQSRLQNIPQSMNLGTANVLAGTIFSQPFDARNGRIKFNFQLNSKSNDVLEPKIKKIQVLSRDQYGGEQILGEVEVNRILWSTSSMDIFEVSVPLKNYDGNEEKKSVSAKVFYEYKTQYVDEFIQTSDSYVFDIASEFHLVRPTIPVKCDISKCNDNNPGTRDYCSSFGCENTPIANACGNFVCDAGENKCTCRTDCGVCEGDAGEFLVYACKANQCTTQPKTTSRQVSVEDTAVLQYFKLSISTVFEEPFNVKTSKFKISISLDDFNQDLIAPLKITKIQLLEGEIKIAEQTQEQSLSKRGDKIEAEAPLVYTPVKAEEEKALTLKIT